MSVTKIFSFFLDLFVILFFTGLVLNVRGQELPTNSSTLFSGSGNCAACHAPGVMNPNALLNSRNQDISPTTLWRSTMMGNGAKDPLWQAKVKAEVAANPHLKEIIEDKCTTCHGPMGRTEAHFNGSSYYSLEELQDDSLALDGVSCTVCHQIKDDALGASGSFSGGYKIENDRIIYGPYQNMFTGPMINFVNYTPQYGQQTEKSELCATCHTLITPTVNNSGEIVGEIMEQTPYLEWKNSIYSEQGVECQTCHMPSLLENIIISNSPPWLGTHTPFAEHHFVGGNVFMLNLLKLYGMELSLTATESQFDSTIARTLRILKNQTAEVSASYFWRTIDTLEVTVKVQNLAGHKFPTGFPSRRSWLTLVITDDQNETVFSSGEWDPESGKIDSGDNGYESHHNLITSQTQIQIYQSVMQDVDGQITQTLLRGTSYIKDNRIPPKGFTTDGPAYDSSAVYGLALEDNDFNRENGIEGSGSDLVTYRIGDLNSSENYKINVKLLYQSVETKFTEDLFLYDIPEVEHFKELYQTVPNNPIVIDSLELFSSVTSILSPPVVVTHSPVLIKTYPNPFNPEVNINVNVYHPGSLQLSVYNVLGEKLTTIVSDFIPEGEYLYQWNVVSDNYQSHASGEYFIETILEENGTGHKYRTVNKVIYIR